MVEQSDLRKSRTILFALVLFVAVLAWPVSFARAQAPGLLWSTNLGATLFAVDSLTNAYAYLGGNVIVIRGDGAALQTNVICPRPGIACRDDAGNYYFSGNFDGTVDFGGITLLGGWTNNPFGGGWRPGYPTCFLAKYASNGGLQWVKSFGAQGGSNYVTDLLLDAGGAAYVGYVKPTHPDVWVARIDNAGVILWEQSVRTFSPIVKLGGLTSSNCCFIASGPDANTLGRLDTSGSNYRVALLGRRVSADMYGKPMIDDLGRILVVCQCSDPISNPQCSAQVIRKYGGGTNLIWEREITTEAHWTLARDALADVYVAGTNGMFAMFDTDGFLVWSNNFARQAISMVVDPSGNRFVSFSDGSITRLASEPAPQPPVLLIPPQPVTVFLGDPVSLSVTAGGTHPLKYFWRFNGANLSGATDTTYSFNNATPSQAGSYTVVVTNFLNSVTSAPALVRVKSVQLYWNSQLLTNGTYVFSTPPTLNIRSAFAAGSSFYTLDGSAPDFTSTYYSGPFTLSQSATVRAIGYSSDFSQTEEADTVNIVVLTRHNLTVATSGGGIVTTNPNPSSTDVNCVALPSGAIAWWRAEASAQDRLGANNGIVYNGAGFTNGMVGQAFNLPQYGMHIRVPDAPSLRPTSAITVEAWVNGGAGTIVSRWDAVAARNQSSYRLRVADNPTGSRNVAFAISPDGFSANGSAVEPVSCIGGSAPLGWFHLAGTYDGSTLRVYINAVLVAQTSFSGPIYSGQDDLGIGASVGGAISGSSFNEFSGMIDEPALYNRALSAAEIQAIYQAGANGKCPNPPFTGGSYVDSDIVTLTAVPFAGNAFLYWLADASGTNPTINVSMEREKSIYAVFGTTLSTTATGGGQVQLSPDGGRYAYGTVVRLTGIPNPGNYFGFWGNAATGNTNPLYFTVSAPTQTVSSIFGAVPAGQTSLTVQISGHGRVQLNPRANTYTLNSPVTLTAVPDSGETFLNWNGDASGTANPLTISMTQNKVITANFSGAPTLSANRRDIEGPVPQGFRLTVINDLPSVSHILVSTDLVSWSVLGSVTNVTREVQILDPGATNSPRRFYKAAP